MTNEFQPASHLFTIRVWQEPLGAGMVEVRFQTKHVLSGESRVFRDGEAVIAYLLEKLAEEGGMSIQAESAEAE